MLSMASRSDASRLDTGCSPRFQWALLERRHEQVTDRSHLSCYNWAISQKEAEQQATTEFSFYLLNPPSRIRCQQVSWTCANTSEWMELRHLLRFTIMPDFPLVPHCHSHPCDVTGVLLVWGTDVVLAHLIAASWLLSQTPGASEHLPPGPGPSRSWWWSGCCHPWTPHGPAEAKQPHSQFTGALAFPSH